MHFNNHFLKSPMRFYRLLIMLAACGLLSVPSFAASKKITKIVLDAGHGGRDNGARGEYSNERTLPWVSY